MKISTNELIASLPAYMVDLISSQILGESVSAKRLAGSLCDTNRLRRLLNNLKPEDKAILIDLYELGGEVNWSVFASIYQHEIDALKAGLARLGELGLVFQGGLTGREVIIMLPSLFSIINDIVGANNLPDRDLVWQKGHRADIHKHILMINVIRSGRLRCRSGTEPYKKGWSLLGQLLGLIADVPRIYWELVELGCIEEKDNMLVINSGCTMGLALDGDLRYRIWRFIESCKGFSGLETEVFTLIGDGAIPRKWLSRVLFLYLKQHCPRLLDADAKVPDLISLWLDLGILEEDTKGEWIRFEKDTCTALRTGKVEIPLEEYQEEIIIQPTMEILVPMDFDPVDHLNIGEIADIEKADTVSIYRITKASVLRGLKNEWALGKIRNFLDRISKHTVADNVAKTIKGWVEAFRHAYIIKGTFLVIKGGKGKILGELEEVLPDIYRISDKCKDDIITSLDKKGIMVNTPDASFDTEAGIDWGKSLPLRLLVQPGKKYVYPDGIYPYGMVISLPYGAERTEIFQQAIDDGSQLIIFYPKKGYGEIQMKRITPVYIYRQAGNFFVEAFCEDTGEGEVFDINKIKAMFRYKPV